MRSNHSYRFSHYHTAQPTSWSTLWIGAGIALTGALACGAFIGTIYFNLIPGVL